jgi:hypothetical protein
MTDPQCHTTIKLRFTEFFEEGTTRDDLKTEEEMEQALLDELALEDDPDVEPHYVRVDAEFEGLENE